MEFTPVDVLWGVVLPFLAALVPVALSWLKPHTAEGWAWWLGPVAACAAFMLAFFTGQARQPFQPSDSVQYLFWAAPAVALGLMVACVVAYRSRRTGDAWSYVIWAAAVVTASVAVAWLLAGNLRTARMVADDGFTEIPRYTMAAVAGKAALSAGAMAAGALLFMGAAARAAARDARTGTAPRLRLKWVSSTRITAVQLWALAAGTAVLLAVGGADPKVGPIRAGSLAIVTSLWFFVRGGRGLPVTLAGFTGILLAGLMSAGLLYFTVKPWHAGVLAGVCVWVAMSAGWNRWLRLGVTFVGVGVPVIIALAEFQRQMVVE